LLDIPFCSCTCAFSHRALPSFPTRRSSDLGPALLSVECRTPAHTVCAFFSCFFPIFFLGAKLNMSCLRIHSVNDRQRFQLVAEIDRKSTRLNSSHVSISYAVFCL